MERWLFPGAQGPFGKASPAVTREGTVPAEGSQALGQALDCRMPAEKGPAAWWPSLAVALLLPVLAQTSLATLVPPLGVLRGGLGPALAAAGVLAALGRRRRWSLGRWLEAPRLGTLVLAAGLAYATVGLAYTRVVQASGDEVEYLMLAQSLWREHDLDLADNFARGDQLEFMPGLSAMPFGTFRADGRPITTHSVGLPLLLAPFYALGGRSACVLLLAALGALLTLETARLARLLTGSETAARWAWLLTAGPPVLFYSFHTYTEVPSTLALVASLRLLLSPATPGRAVAAALLASALPWLHVKLIPAAAVLGALGLLRLAGSARWAFAVTAAACGAAYLAFYGLVYGDPWPLALYGSKVPKKVRRSDPGQSLTGLFFDSSFGLLFTAPAFALAAAASASLRRRLTRDGAAAVALGLALLLPLAFWQTWWAGSCPPARFLVPLAPLLAVAAATRLTRPHGLARWGGPLALGGWALALFMSLRPAEQLLLNGRGNPTLAWEALGGQPTLGRYLPLLVSGEPAESRVALVWGVALLALLALDALAAKRQRVDDAFGRPWLPLTLAATVAAAIELWARR